jgi:pimeloyl-ACP methyl ester carboxylesterase
VSTARRPRAARPPRSAHDPLVGLFDLIVIPAAVGLAAGVLVGRRLGGWATFAAALLAPAVLALVADGAYRVVDPDAGCSDECWGVLIYGAAWLGASVGAEVGLAVGAVTASARRARDRRASSP